VAALGGAPVGVRTGPRYVSVMHVHSIPPSSVSRRPDGPAGGPGERGAYVWPCDRPCDARGHRHGMNGTSARWTGAEYRLCGVPATRRTAGLRPVVLPGEAYVKGRDRAQEIPSFRLQSRAGRVAHSRCATSLASLCDPSSTVVTKASCRLTHGYPRNGETPLDARILQQYPGPGQFNPTFLALSSISPPHTIRRCFSN
jgi:hypothetical protein